MNYNIRFTTFAKNSLEDIFQYIHDRTMSTQSARNTMKMIRTEVNRLGTSAKIGINFDKKIGFQLLANTTTYMIVAKQYLIFYVIIDSTVYILEIVNGKTDYLNKLERAIKHSKKELSNIQD